MHSDNNEARQDCATSAAVPAGREETEQFGCFGEIVESELLAAMGCTEPIALALAGAKTRDLLGEMPARADVYCSGNIIKNVKAVKIPGTNGRRGIETAVAMGLAMGGSGKGLQVLEGAGEQQASEAYRLEREGRLEVHLEQGAENLYIRIEASSDSHRSIVELKNQHNQFARLELDGRILSDREEEACTEFGDMARLLTPDFILDYAEELPIMEEENRGLRELLLRQAQYNEAIGREGIRGGYGAGIGQLLAGQNRQQDPLLEGIAVAAGGSDARMSGIEMPVVINSGSGNQGMTIACPIVVYWRSTGQPEETLCRALLLANLLAVCEKSYIGKLSAYCGAVRAAAAAGAGIAYLMGMERGDICQVAEDTLAIASGVLCDGAKPSCAAKIAASLNCAKMALDMTKAKRSFRQGEGIVGSGLMDTIRNVGCIAREGMGVTDQVMLKVMLNNPFPQGA